MTMMVLVVVFVLGVRGGPSEGELRCLCASQGVVKPIVCFRMN